MEHKEMRWPKLAFICAAALVLFLVAVNQVDRQVAELETQSSTLTGQMSSLHEQQEELNTEISQVGTGSYIEERARRDYQYLSPGELRFEITNPGALYDQTDEMIAQAAQMVDAAAP